MSHEFESGFFAGNRPAWHGLGTVIERDGATSQEALVLAGLDWQVRTEPLMFSGEHILDKHLTVRSSDNSALGVVGSRYTPIQNEEAFKFGDALVDSGEAHWHTAGSLRNGQIVFMTMKVGNDTTVGGVDRLQQYLVITTGHNGSWPMRCFITNIRVECMNLLRLAMRDATDQVVIRHTRSSGQTLSEARRVLGLSMQNAAATVEQAERLMSISVGANEFDAMMNDIIPKVELIDGDYKKYNRAVDKRDEVISNYAYTWNNSPNLENVRRTAWGAVNAIIEYDDHHTEYRSAKTPARERRFMDIVVDGHKTAEKAAERFLVTA